MTDIKKDIKQFLIFLLLLFFILNSLTGLIKFPELQRYFIFIYNYISAGNLTLLHDISGLALVFLIVVHLAINKNRIFKR